MWVQFFTTRNSFRSRHVCCRALFPRFVAVDVVFIYVMKCGHATLTSLRLNADQAENYFKLFCSRSRSDSTTVLLEFHFSVAIRQIRGVQKQKLPNWLFVFINDSLGRLVVSSYSSLLLQSNGLLALLISKRVT